jgi:mono/diheme cytochrome c family protein
MRRIAAALLAMGVGMMIAAAIGCKSIPPPTPLDQLTPQQARGHAVFQARCSMCHYDRRSGPLAGPSLKGIFKQEYLPSGAPSNDDRVTATILQGRNMMPPMGNSMDTQEVMDVVAYLHTL